MSVQQAKANSKNNKAWSHPGPVCAFSSESVNKMKQEAKKANVALVDEKYPTGEYEVVKQYEKLEPCPEWRKKLEVSERRVRNREQNNPTMKMLKAVMDLKESSGGSSDILEENKVLKEQNSMLMEEISEIKAMLLQGKEENKPSDPLKPKE